MKKHTLFCMMLICTVQTSYFYASMRGFQTPARRKGIVADEIPALSPSHTGAGAMPSSTEFKSPTHADRKPGTGMSPAAKVVLVRQMLSPGTVGRLHDAGKSAGVAIMGEMPRMPELDTRTPEEKMIERNAAKWRAWVALHPELHRKHK